VCFAVGILGLGRRCLIAWLGIPALLWLLLVPKPVLLEGEVWRAESPYNLLRVIRHENLVWLVLNDTRYFHTIRNLKDVWTGYFTISSRRVHSWFRDGRFWSWDGRGGTIAATLAVAPDIQVDGVEIDPKVVEAEFSFSG